MTERKLPRDHQELIDRATAYLGLFAREGDVVTCENGHTICRVAKDIPLGALHDADFFTDWQQPEPKVGTRPTPACTICGARWVGGAGGLHFKDGWR